MSYKNELESNNDFNESLKKKYKYFEDNSKQ